MVERFRSQVGTVFWVSLAFSVVFVVWGVFFTASLAAVFDATLTYVVSSFGWVYLIAVTGFLVFVAYLALSRHGRIRLGKDDERPEFSTIAWISMLFAAGVGLSFLFWGVAEPASHLGTTPYGLAEPNTTEAAGLSLQYTFFHWGLHPWAVYAVVAMAIAYFSFRKGGGSLISATLRPLFGDRVEGALGKVVDVLAIVAVLFGVATALGIGAQQMNGGLSYVFGAPADSLPVQFVVIAVLTLAFLISAATGINRGIKILSLVNVTLAFLLMLFVLFAGPTVFLMETFTESIGRYLGELAPMSFQTEAFGDGSWAEAWTLFYWAWWVSWAPFVGTFIARISKGRTIREFVMGVIFAPTIVSFVWFTVFGGTAIHLDLFGNGAIAETAATNLPQALFDTLASLPLGFLISIVALVLVSIFFVTSGDSATFVLGSMSTGGSENPSALVKIAWGLVIALFASILLVAGGLQALQTATITAAVPFAVVMIAICFSLYKSLAAEARESEEARRSLLERGAERLSRPSGGVANPAPSRDR
ncbi:bcct: transporter, betaine/carnitine/choline transporter (BCCT) family [Rubrobacter radiotolerans]|uniref:BCCT family transporter n=1 Tax=Rubrobacter radiotolerans TaxID=42256 RepID=A0A023X014_RUBRA|nr:BCCT family transporter [Rubrobacter radiotolerans]AHY45360.1 bcct: transporter, betaine/carnitine/choline transporter (BCCT) family [Rubrobacter radiotolerans]MDX5892771.1 BCCT family transporter [Rubrobacter radiotolerans]SMC02468.1 glycine betaine transporter [Rubrobacter radiotolerans DSM 5868]